MNSEGFTRKFDGGNAMQHYNDLTECIQMCDRMLRSTTFPRSSDLSKTDVSKVQAFHPVDKYAPAESPLAVAKSASPLHPSRTIVVQNFVPEAEVHVRSFVAMFGIVEICELFKDDIPSALAVVQYKFKRSAADAMLAMSSCQVRSSNLIVNLLWNGPYEQIGSITAGVHRSFRECAEKRVVCVGQLPRSITEEAIRWKCDRYGAVESVRVQPQEQGAFAYVVFRSALAAAVATYCLRNSTASNAALMLGYSENGSPVLLGPIRVRPLDHYYVPLTAFDVRCICTRFLDYSRMYGIFVNLQRKFPMHQFFKPGSVEYCLRVPTTQVKGVWFFIEVLLFEDIATRSGESISEMAYQLCSQKYLYRFTIDFGLHKPIMTHDEKLPRQNAHFLRWNSFFILDLQICIPWGHSEPRLEPRIQGMNHVHSDINSKAFKDDNDSGSWFGLALRHSIHSQGGRGTSGDDNQHVGKVRYLLSNNTPLVRLVGSLDEVNGFQIPVHVYSDAQVK